MVRRSRQDDTEYLRRQLVALLTDFEQQLESGELRDKVLALIPAHHLLRDLGASLVPPEIASAGRSRILHYFRMYQRIAIAGDELMVVSGIGEWARRVRELRVQDGWRIVSGVTLGEMREVDEGAGAELPDLATDEYMLVDDVQDLEAAHRWHVANRIRKTQASVRDKLLAYFRENAGAMITGEELRYVAGDKTEWARRTRELRTEYGWPVVTQNTGNPDLPVGVYVLEADRQAPAHDRTIPDSVRREVLRRDGYACTTCGWNQKEWDRSDPRHLEAHHVKQHKDGGENTAENLVTLCTVCHDVLHAAEET